MKALRTLLHAGVVVSLSACASGGASGSRGAAPVTTSTVAPSPLVGPPELAAVGEAPLVQDDRVGVRRAFDQTLRLERGHLAREAERPGPRELLLQPLRPHRAARRLA